MRQYPNSLKLQAQSLRTQGLTYPEIRHKLDRHIPKGTLSGWFKHITPPPQYFERIKSLTGNNIWKAQAVNKLKHEARLQNLRNKNTDLIKHVDKNIGKLILAVLYWCEGAKYPSRSNLQFGNSDPGMMQTFLTLLRTCYPIDEDKFRVTIQCRADQDQTTLTNFWTQITRIPASQHYKPYVDARTIGKPTLKKNYHGVCVVAYFDANLQCELQFTGELLGSQSVINQMKKQLN